MQVEVVLLMEFEWHIRNFEEREVGAIAEPVERMQRMGLASALGLLDLQRAAQRQPEKVFVEAPRLLRVAAAVSVVMQAFDHGGSPKRDAHERAHKLTKMPMLRLTQPERSTDREGRRSRGSTDDQHAHTATPGRTPGEEA